MGRTHSRRGKGAARRRLRSRVSACCKADATQPSSGDVVWAGIEALHGGAAVRQLLSAELLTAWCGEARRHASLRAMRNLLKVREAAPLHPSFGGGRAPACWCDLNASRCAACAPGTHRMRGEQLPAEGIETFGCSACARRPSGWLATMATLKQSLKRRWARSAAPSSTASSSSCCERSAHRPCSLCHAAALSVPQAAA